MADLKPSVGTPTANSYVSLASANTYFDGRYSTDMWDGIAASTNATASDNVKKSLLIQATREIDITYRFFGSKYNLGLIGSTDYQNLEFPRFSDTDTNGDIYIQEDVKRTTYEQALWILERQTARKTQEGTITKRAFFGPEAYQYIRPSVNRIARQVNNPPWGQSTY